MARSSSELEEDNDFDTASFILGFCYGVSFGVFLVIFLIKYI